jgi:hypothetical protein
MRWLALLVLLAIGCAGRAGARGGRGGADDGDRFERVHRLIDLYDTARFAHATAERAELGHQLGFEVGTGPAATERVIAALLVEVDRVLAADRLHGGAQAARTLLEFDGKPPAARAEVLQRMAEVKAIARGRGPLAPNARLRLAGYCWRALDDATRAIWRQRHFAAAHCLYALYDSDPDPYFSRDPDRRPPLPAWTSLVEDASGLLRGAARSHLEAVAMRVMVDLGAIDGEELPVEPEVDVVVPDAPLYDWAPIVEKGTAGAALREQVQGDGRAEVAVRLWPEATGETLRMMASGAMSAGATEIQLLVARKQTIVAPPGAYWHGRSVPSTRAAVIPVSLAPLGAAAKGPRASYPIDFAAGLGLHLVIGERTVTLTSKDGALASDSDPARITDMLGQIRKAFPDQQALSVVVEPSATYKVIAPTLAAAARRNGAPFFRLGLAAKAPAVRGSSLARRVTLRAGASVAVVPDTLAARKPALLACYQDAVEKAPKLAGTVRLEPKNGAAAVTGKADRRLAACATRAIGRALLDSGATSAEVTFRVSESR